MATFRELNPQEVPIVRALLAKSVLPFEVATLFGCRVDSVVRILAGEKYAEVPAADMCAAENVWALDRLIDGFAARLRHAAQSVAVDKA